MRRHFNWPALLLIGACSNDDDIIPDARQPDAVPPKPCSVTLSPSASDQTSVQSALIGARTGDLICFGAGTFTFTDELSLSVEGVTLRGATRDATIFDFSTQATGGNAVKVTAGDFIVEQLTIRDPKGDGIRVEGVTNVTFRDVKVFWTVSRSPTNGAYGVYPVLCTNVLVENVEVSGAVDAAIYVGQSRNIVVRSSSAHDSVAGIEIENSTDVEVTGNTSTDNSGGILVFNLPGLPTKTGARTKVHGNTITNNNGENFAPAGTVRFFPVGTGILALAADNTEIHDNTITDNDSVGVLYVSCQGLAMAGVEELICNDTGYDGIPEGGFIHDNTYSGNGSMPDTLLTGLGIATGPSVFYDGLFPPTDADEKLCIQEAVGTTFLNFSSQTDTLADFNCTHPALPPISVTWATSP
jgi:parallel beta-helix repeat protein